MAMSIWEGSKYIKLGEKLKRECKKNFICGAMLGNYLQGSVRGFLTERRREDKFSSCTFYDLI